MFCSICINILKHIDKLIPCYFIHVFCNTCLNSHVA
ncbi:MAG: hypothetical protein IJ186_00180 [Bacilli bacterium]|nr:hypothetical protein [Bacilli bacterium]